jgi:putative tricarboxylic transport membrane protein
MRAAEMASEPVELIVHGPPGSAPPVLAAALAAAHGEANPGDPPWRLVARGDDPGVDAMLALSARRGDPKLLSTCTPVFLQAPLLRGLTLTHRQLTPIARLVADRYLLVARMDSPWRSATDFLADIARRPTRTGGYFKGGINHLLALAIAAAADADVAFIVVPSEPAVWVELMTGGLDWGCGVAAEVLSHIEAGTLRAIAALDDRRLAGFPDVPTLAEAGAPVSFKLWRGLMGPPGLSIADELRWHDAIAGLRRTRAWQSYLQRNGQTDDFLAGEPFKAFLESEWAWYEKHLGLAGLLPVPA